MFGKKGFTLIELLLVIVVISLILGMGIPLVNKNINKTFFYNFTNKVYFLFEYAKSRAILRNEITKVIIDPESELIQISQSQDQSIEFRKVKIPSDIEIQADSLEILFYPNGTIMEFEISITNKDRLFCILSSQGFDGKIINSLNE